MEFALSKPLPNLPSYEHDDTPTFGQYYIVCGINLK